MRIQSPSLSELHAFAEAARLGSYTLAAEQLSVTQGAISRAIARLEEHLGCALFERQGRRNVLTAAGQQYLDAVAPALFTIESATASLRHRPHGQQLCLSVPPTLFSQWLIPRLPDFSARHPGTVLRFAPYRRDDPLTSAQIDAWVRIGAAPWPEPLQADYLVGQDLVPICRPQDMEGEDGIRTAQDLRARPLLAHTNYPDNWACWFQAMGDSRPCPAPVADFELVTQLVQGVIAGLGVAVVQRCLIAQDLATGRVVVPVQQAFRIARGYFLCRPAQRPAHPAWEDFRHWVLEQAAADVSSLA
ncbi:MAG: LysR family transcriptional regulator [Acidovorax sp.]|jgi:DNA-binding transcriptional LysR family regulator|nr:LysR family transcriptional regulator [Acidovorax sp.]